MCDTCVVDICCAGLVTDYKWRFSCIRSVNLELDWACRVAHPKAKPSIVVAAADI